MSSASSLTDRLRSIGPETISFAIIGAGNTLLYLAITAALLSIGAVKANVVATIITTTLAYFANRYWTYRNHSRTALRREYMLFFSFNLIGMLIQAGATAVGKYGFHLNESDHKLELLGFTVIGICIATLFRFWAYRTFVFLKPPVDEHEESLTGLDATAGLAELSAENHPGSAAQFDLEHR